MSFEQWDGNDASLYENVQTMIEHNGKVITAAPESVLIETERRSACGHCEADGHCGTSVIAALFRQRASQIRLDNNMDLQSGDEVILGIPEHLLLRAALWAYMVPMLFMIVFALVVGTAGFSDIYVFLASMAGLFNGLYLAGVIYSRKLSDEIVLLRKINPNPARVNIYIQKR